MEDVTSPKTVQLVSVGAHLGMNISPLFLINLLPSPVPAVMAEQEVLT
jgi:hypothetical protein